MKKKSLLSDPNPKSPANNKAARLLTMDIVEYDRMVQISVEESWRHFEEKDWLK